ncbi:MAG: Fic family protein [Gammaproteobacteria bacterium]|nr:Fic family protein [Gammaproteobacteria bacterium]
MRHATHVPPPYDSVCDCMETLFQCMANEPHPGVKAILAHWLIGFIHPYMDGNGRMARFIMNALLCCYGYPWTIIRVETRSAYLSALEKASVHCELNNFTQLVLEAMQQTERL